MQKSLIAILIVVILAVLGTIAYWQFGPGTSMSLKTPSPSEKRYARLELRGDVFLLDIADTTALRAQGLSGRATLGARGGMIFLFDEESRFSFWMKDMNFPIDIIWLLRDEVVAVTRGALPPLPGATDAELLRYTPPTPYTRVIELNAGAASRYDIEVGQKLEISLP